MAKAGGNTTTTWILLFEARALVIRAYDGAVRLAETQLVEWLGDGRVRWSCKLFKAAPVSKLAALNADPAGPVFFVGVADVAYSNGDPAFWRIGLNTNWEENSAYQTHALGGGNNAYGIRVVREDLLALLPEGPDEHEEAAALSASAQWIAAEARQMKAVGQIAPDIKITDFADELARRMRKAADADRSIRPLKMESIRNMLGEWGLWPVTRIK
jgi:hypothetical protein